MQDKVILSPIFLFSKIKVLQGELKKVGSTNTITCHILTTLDYETLEQGGAFNYEEYFRNVYFLEKDNP